MTTKAQRSWLDAPAWWQRWKPLRILALGVIGYFFYTTAGTVQKYVMTPEENPQTAYYTAVETARVALGPFRSYDNLATARAALTTAGLTWTESALHAPPSELYPPHLMDTLNVKKFRHLDNDGELTLEFFNDRLYEVDFVPEDPAAYSRALHAALPALQRNRIGTSVWVDGSLRVASNVDLAKSDVGQSLDSKPYVIWQDLRLIKQRDQWDRDYHEIPVKAQ